MKPPSLSFFFSEADHIEHRINSFLVRGFRSEWGCGFTVGVLSEFSRHCFKLVGGPDERGIS